MTTAEALAVVREARPSTPDVPCIHCTHDFCRCRRETEEFDAALALIEREVERMRLELVRVDEMVSRYSQSADAVSEDRARWMERYAELEAALRELLAQGVDDVDPRLGYVYIQADREAVAAARRVLGGGE